MPVKKFASLVVIVCLFAVGVPLGLKKLGWIGGERKVQAAAAAAPAVVPVSTGVSPIERQTLQEVPVRKKIVIPDEVETAVVVNPLRVKGIVMKGDRFRVVLTDGRILTQRDELVKWGGSTGVELVDGTRLWMVEPRVKEPVVKDLFIAPPVPVPERVEAVEDVLPVVVETAPVERSKRPPARATSRAVIRRGTGTGTGTGVFGRP